MQNYIRQQTQMGNSKEQIYKNLLAEGLQVSEIQQAFGDTLSEVPSRSPSGDSLWALDSKIRAMIGVYFLFLIIIVFGYSYLASAAPSQGLFVAAMIVSIIPTALVIYIFRKGKSK